MIIGIDIRPLSGGRKSGVEEYTINLLLNLFRQDNRNTYKLFCNSFGEPGIDFELFSKYKNVEICSFRYPNKFLNFSFKFLNLPKIDKLIAPVDVFFEPNILFSALSSSCPRVVTFHDLSYLFFANFYSAKRRLWHWAVNPRQIAQRAQKFIAVSESTKSDLVNYFGVAENKITVVHSGLSSELYFDQSPKTGDLSKVQNRYNLPSKFILHLGVIEPRKNVMGLVAAFEKLKKEKGISHQLVLAGSPGWLYQNILKRIKQSPVADEIILLGLVADEHKPQLYSLADLFVFPSFYEGFGFPVLEAMACQTPVVTSPVSSLPEICGSAALYADPYNINELAEVMWQGLSNQKLRDDLVQKGQAQARKFSWEDSARKTLEVFEGL